MKGKHKTVLNIVILVINIIISIVLCVLIIEKYEHIDTLNFLVIPGFILLMLSLSKRVKRKLPYWTGFLIFNIYNVLIYMIESFYKFIDKYFNLF